MCQTMHTENDHRHCHNPFISGAYATLDTLYIFTITGDRGTFCIYALSSEVTSASDNVAVIVSSTESVSSTRLTDAYLLAKSATSGILTEGWTQGSI